MKNTPQSDLHDMSFDAQELLALARIDAERGALESALSKIKQLIGDPKASADALGFGGRLYAQLGLWDRAQDLLQRCLKLNPQADIEIFQLGMVHFQAGRPDEAMKIWADVLQKYPDHPPALFYRALTFAQQGKLTEARQGIELLLKAAPADNLYFGRGKELLRAIESQQQQNARSTGAVQHEKEVFAAIAKDAYKDSR